MTTATELARTFAAVAETNYQADGALAPTVVLVGKRQVFLTLAPTDDVPTAAARCVMAMAAVVRPDYVVLISETWQRELPPERAHEMETYEHGQLEREEAAGDTTVYTALMIHAFDTKRSDRSHVITIKDHGDHMERTFDGTGRSEGRVPDLLEEAYALGVELEPPSLDMEFLARLLATAGWITSMAYEQ